MLRPIPCLVGLALLSAAAPCGADETPLFRLFLRDGTAIACLGEFAHVCEAEAIFLARLGALARH